MQMSEAELYDMTPRTFANKSKGYNLKREYDYKLQMELHRESIITLLSPHLSKRHKNKTQHQLYPLPWDKEAKETSQKKKIDPVDFWKKIDEKRWN